MLKKIMISTLCFMAFSASSNLFAFEIVKDEPIKASVALHNSGSRGHSLQAEPSKQEVVLIHVKLTPEEQQTVSNYNPKATAANKTTSGLPSSINLGMNGVPVLDQGAHGACVVFAVTAAIDALLGQGDYISQLCHLELGDYLANSHFSAPNGWDGSVAPWEIEQIMRFGIVSKAVQKTKSCAGITEYPQWNENSRGNPMTLDEYKQSSQNLYDLIFPVYIMNPYQRTHMQQTGVDFYDQVLTLVKVSLYRGNRLVMGTLLQLPPTCDAGACASYHVSLDTWALTSDIDPSWGIDTAHEMVIIGYDDFAVATDQQGNKHQGLLILRNSWGPFVGDHGNYYMTYDFFKKYADEVQSIVVAPQRN